MRSPVDEYIGSDYSLLNDPHVTAEAIDLNFKVPAEALLQRVLLQDVASNWEGQISHPQCCQTRTAATFGGWWNNLLHAEPHPGSACLPLVKVSCLIW